MVQHVCEATQQREQLLEESVTGTGTGAPSRMRQTMPRVPIPSDLRKVLLFNSFVALLTWGGGAVVVSIWGGDPNPGSRLDTIGEVLLTIPLLPVKQAMGNPPFSDWWLSQPVAVCWCIGLLMMGSFQFASPRRAGVVTVGLVATGLWFGTGALLCLVCSMAAV